MLALMALYLMEEQQEMERRRRAQRAKRKKEEEERRKKREKERQRRIIEERRNAPLEYDEEKKWQIERCVKVISLNKDVKKLNNVLESKREEIIENDTKEIDNNLVNISRKYELQRKQVEDTINILENLNVKVSGSNYNLSRVGMFNLVGTLDMKSDIFGEVFSPNMKKGIRINEDILSSGNLYKLAYERTKPEETQQQYDEVTKKVNRYKKIGKYLKFILSREEYNSLVIRQRQLAENLEYVNEAKESLDSYNSLTKAQLEAIRNYLNELKKLLNINSTIVRIYEQKNALKYDKSDKMYKRSLALVLEDEELQPLVIESIKYIKKICTNDERTLEVGKRILDEHQNEDTENYRLCEFLLSNRELISLELDNPKQYIKK